MSRNLEENIHFINNLYNSYTSLSSKILILKEIVYICMKYLCLWIENRKVCWHGCALNYVLKGTVNILTLFVIFMDIFMSL